MSKECEKVAEEICEASEDIIDQDEDLSSAGVDFSKQSSFVMDFESSFTEKGNFIFLSLQCLQWQNFVHFENW